MEIQATTRLPFALLLTLAFPAPVLAQMDTLLVSACGRAEASLGSAATGSEYHRSITVLVSCPAGASALARQRASPPRDSLSLRSLAGMSAILRDQRVFDAARGAVADGTASPDTRLAAMRVLVGHYDACLSVEFDRNPSRLSPGMQVAVMLGHNAHDVSTRGTRPLPASVKDDVLSTLDAVAASGSDEQVRQAATGLAIRIRRLPAPGPRC